MPEGEHEAAARPDARTWAALAAGLLLFAAWLLGHGGAGRPHRATPGGRAPAAVAADRPRAVYAPHAPLPGARPLRLDIGSVGVHAPLVPRGLWDGAIEPPPYATPGVAGWYRDGPEPGAAGAAIVVGHVDTETGPAVFLPLSAVRPGALVEVTRADGVVARFSVEAVELVPKDRFDPDRVYGSTGRPELRLITCGGSFDRARREYSANLVVFAVLTGSRPA